MVVLEKNIEIKEIDISLDKKILDKELKKKEKEFLLKGGLSFKNSYKKTMNFISTYNN